MMAPRPREPAIQRRQQIASLAQAFCQAEEGAGTAAKAP
jgi:hypothetical protein